MTLPSRLCRSLRRPTPPRRLRVMYWLMAAIAAISLAMLHVALTGERRLETELTAATRDYLSAPRVIVVRVPPAPRAAMKVNPNTHRAAGATKEK